jgi:D-3-phosphoglycerate dehydrogenase
MLSRINDHFLAAENVNIDGQYLQTDPNIGYVVIDVTTTRERLQALKDALNEIPGTLRTRVLY